jgi:hypothetical protein
MHKGQPEALTTPEERTIQLVNMKRLSKLFYATAHAIGCHAFIEFTGLMNEWLKMAEEAHKQGIDFNACNTHSGHALPMQPFQRNYINEKLECIFLGQSVMAEILPPSNDSEASKALATGLPAAVQQLQLLIDAVHVLRKEGPDKFNWLALQGVGGALVGAKDYVERAITEHPLISDLQYAGFANEDDDNVDRSKAEVR